MWVRGIYDNVTNTIAIRLMQHQLRQLTGLTVKQSGHWIRVAVVTTHKSLLHPQHLTKCSKGEMVAPGTVPEHSSGGYRRSLLR